MELKRMIIISIVPSCLECTMLEAQMGDCLDRVMAWLSLPRPLLGYIFNPFKI
jgi:hypothetical protein